MASKKVFAVAYGGVLTALSVVLLLVGNVPFAEFVAPVFAGIIALFAYVELTGKYALLVYLATTIVGLVVSPNKEPVLLYACFFGYYPSVKFALDKGIKFKLLRAIIKLLVFNCAMVVAYLILVFLFKVPIEEIGALGKWTLVLLLGIANVLFVLFESTLRVFSLFYEKVLQPKVHKAFNIKKK